MKNQLLMFIGTDCPHCDSMRPLVAKLQFETGCNITELDVWKDEAAYRKLENYQAEIIKKDPACDGIPFFYNTKTKGHLCGEVSYRKLKDWAIL